MGFTAEQRAKALASRVANAAARRAAKAKAKGKDAHIEIASFAGVTDPSKKELLAKIAELQSKLQTSESKRSEAEQAAITAAESQEFMAGMDTEEKPTGRTVEVDRLDHYKVVGHKDDGRPIREPVFKKIRLPTFAYRINMPPVGGTDMKINGLPFYHGAVYTLDIDTLRTVKDMVHRLWDHDRQIHGTDENAYRKKTQQRISARGY